MRFLAWLLGSILLMAFSITLNATQTDSLEPITVDNASEIQRLQAIGRGTVTIAEWSPDGEIIAVGGSQGIWLYNANNLSETPRHLNAHDAPISTLAFSPDGTILASGSADWVQVDSDIHIWNVQTSELLTTLSEHRHNIGALAFHPNGELLISAGWGFIDGMLRVWQVDGTDITLHSSMNIPYGGGADIEVSPDGIQVAFAFSDNIRTDGGLIAIISLDDLLSGVDNLQVIDGSSVVTEAVSYHPDSLHLAYSASITMGIWNRLDQSYDFQGQPVGFWSIYDVAYSPMGDLLAIALSNSEIHFWDAETHEPEFTITWYEDEETRDELFSPSSAQYNINFHPDGSQLLIQLADNTVQLWDVYTQELIGVIEGFTPPVSQMSFTDEFGVIAVGTDGIGQLHIWGNEINHQVISPPDGGRISNVILSADGNLIAYKLYELDNTTHIEVFNFEQNTLVRIMTVNGHSKPIAFTPDGTRLLTTRNNDVFELWDVTNLQFIRVLDFPILFVEDLHFLENGNQIYFLGSRDIEIGRFDLNSDTWQTVIESTAVIYSFMPSPNGDLLAVGTGNRYEYFVDPSPLEIYDLISEELIASLDGHTDIINTVDFHPYEPIVASGSWDSTVRLWDINENEQISLIDECPDEIMNVQFNETGTRLAIAGKDGTIHLWGVPSTND